MGRVRSRWTVQQRNSPQHAACHIPGYALGIPVRVKQGLSRFREFSVGIWDGRVVATCYSLLRITSMVSTLSGCRYARANVITRAKEMRQGEREEGERERDLDP